MAKHSQEYQQCQVSKYRNEGKVCVRIIILELVLEEPDEYDDIEPPEDIEDSYEDEVMEDNYEDDVYDDVLEANHPQPTSNMNKGIRLQKPIPIDPGTRKSTKSGPPPPIPSKNKPQEEEEEEVSFETYEDNVYLQTDDIVDKTKERENKFTFRDSSFDSDNGDIEIPEVSPVAFKMLPPKPTFLPKPSGKPFLNKFQKPLPSKPMAPAHQKETIGKLQLHSKPLISIKPYHPSAQNP